MQPAKPCCLTGIHTDTKLQLAVVRVTTKYLQCTFQLNPLPKFLNSHYKSGLNTFTDTPLPPHKKKFSTLHDEAACNRQSLTATWMQEKSCIFLSVTVSVFASCLQQIPHTLCELLTLKKDTVVFHKHYNWNYFLFTNSSHLRILMHVCAGVNSVVITMWRRWFYWFMWKWSKELSCGLAN